MLEANLLANICYSCQLLLCFILGRLRRFDSRAGPEGSTMETLFAFDMVLLSLEQVIIRKPGMIKGGFEDERGLYIFPVVSCVLSCSFLGKLLMQQGLPTKQMNISTRQITVAWRSICPYRHEIDTGLRMSTPTNVRTCSGMHAVDGTSDSRLPLLSVASSDELLPCPAV